MKYMKSVFWKIFGILVIAALLLVACDRPTSSKSGSSSSTQAKAYTVAADQVTTSSAVLNGRITMGSTVAPDLKIGFQYSKSAGIMPSNSTTVEVTDTEANYNFSAENYNFSAEITGLEPSMTYYFRSFFPRYGLPELRVDRLLQFRLCRRGRRLPFRRSICPSRLRIKSGQAKASPTAVC